ncbi:hypothetical protein ACSV5M_14535 [Cellvibrio sp. ARAG 10.3]|uniref:hypothetical protein n=1 Tax=Cellvibrio sp. ARAG 10.3 TaxID=3451358 RepID=UPI003F47CD78
MSASNERLIDSAIALAVVTAFLYASGTARFGGYTSTLKLDVNMLDRNFHQTLYIGFLTAFPPALLVLAILFIAFLFYSYLALPSVIDWMRGNIRAKRRYVRIRKCLMGKRKDIFIEERAKHYTNFIGACIFTLVVALIALVHIERVGVKDAEKIITKLENGEYRPSDFIEVNIDGEVKHLLYLGCGSRNCAAIDPEAGEVTYFPQRVHSYIFALNKKSQPVRRD